MLCGESFFLGPRSRLDLRAILGKGKKRTLRPLGCGPPKVLQLKPRGCTDSAPRYRLPSIRFLSEVCGVEEDTCCFLLAAFFLALSFGENRKSGVVACYMNRGAMLRIL